MEMLKGQYSYYILLIIVIIVMVIILMTIGVEAIGAALKILYPS